MTPRQLPGIIGAMTAPPNKTIKPSAPDWERIELDYRTGLKTLRQIADEHGITHVAINKRAKRDGWSRDLSGKIAKKADELVTKSLVTKLVTKESRISERELIDANAEAIVRVKLSHRKDISRSRAILMRMFDELELTCGSENAALLAELGEIMREPDDRGQDKRADLYAKLLSLNGRSVTMKNLSESLKGLVALEREAFNLNTAPTGPANPLEMLLKTLAGGNSSAFQPVHDDPEHADA